MKFPKKYIERGERKLSSGRVSDVFYNGEALLADHFYLSFVLDAMPRSAHYIGIATGGLVMAMRAHFAVPGSQFSYIHDGRLYGPKPEYEHVLLDDIITTGGSINRAMEIIGKIPREIFVLYDRREKNESPKVKSLFLP